MATPRDSDNLFLIVVLERCAKTAGRAMAALRAEQLTALKLPHVSHLPLACERMRAKVFVVDAAKPGEEELAAIRLMRAKDPTGGLIVILVGDVDPKSLTTEMRAQLTAYLQKPLEWKTLARTVAQLANNRKPPTTRVTLLRQQA